MSKSLLPAVVVVLLGLAGCCPCMHVQPPQPLPPPISLHEQLRILNARARNLGQLTAAGTLVIRYVDQHGNQQQTVDGRLLIRQHYAPEGGGADTADVFLSGRAFEQEMFRAGKNSEKWWFVMWGDTKTAWVGKVGEADDAGTADSPEANTPDLGAGGGEGPGFLRADALLDVLAVTEILPQENHTLAMTIDDQERSNNILIVQSRPGGTGWVKREIIVDRDTGNVRQVKLFDRSGILLVQSELKDYRPVTYREGDDVPAGFVPPLFPCDIRITFPTKKASIHFTLSPDEGKKPELRTQLPDAPFELPDLTGLKVMESNGK